VKVSAGDTILVTATPGVTERVVKVGVPPDNSHSGEHVGLVLILKVFAPVEHA